MVFGFDVGSTFANITMLVALILVILWLGLSIAYCISRKVPEEGKKNRSKKSRRQKFEEYWGDVDDSSTHSTSALNYDSNGSAHYMETDVSHTGLMTKA
jgi:hypothetical protein